MILKRRKILRPVFFCHWQLIADLYHKGVKMSWKGATLIAISPSGNCMRSRNAQRISPLLSVCCWKHKVWQPWSGEGGDDRKPSLWPLHHHVTGMMFVHLSPHFTLPPSLPRPEEMEKDTDSQEKVSFICQLIFPVIDGELIPSHISPGEVFGSESCLAL